MSNLNTNILKAHASIVKAADAEVYSREAEVERNKARAQSGILFEEFAREYVNRNLDSFPKMTNKTHVVQFNDRDEVVNKEQCTSTALWVVTLVQTLRNGYVNKAALTTAFQNWCFEECDFKWAQRAAGKVAMAYIEQLIKMQIIEDKLVDMEYQVDGQMVKGRAAMLTASFIQHRDFIINDMWDKVSMKCAPMEFKPSPWTYNRNMTLSLVTGGHKEQPEQVLDAVNRLQGVKFICHPAIVDICYDYLYNESHYAPNKGDLTEAEYKKQAAEYINFIKMCQEIVDLEGKEFYFPVTMDKRGRMYYRGGLVSPQGNDLCKAAFQFAEKKPLGANGYRALHITLANALGYDKLSIEERVEEAGKVAASYREPYTCIEEFSKDFPKADKFQAWVAYLELNAVDRAFDNSKPSDNTLETFESNLVCHQDGTCNGLQHMAAITKNRATAQAVNCTESTSHDTPADIYGLVSSEAASFCSSAAAELVHAFGRSMAKKPVMVTGYGAGEATVCRAVSEFLADHGHKQTHANEIGKAYIKAINMYAEAVRTFTKSVVFMMDRAMKTGVLHGGVEWVTADGFVAHTMYEDFEAQRVRGKTYNAKCAGLGKSCDDDVKTVYAMAPNFIHSIDATHLRMVVRQCDFDLVTVHDSIGSHACDYEETSRVIREQFVKVHDYDALGNLCEFLGQRKPQFKGDYVVNEALNSTYIFS